MHKLIGIGAPTACAFILLNGNTFAQQATALPPGTDAFIAGTNALVKTAEDLVTNGRTEERLLRLRTALTRTLKTTQAFDKPIKIKLESTNILCGPRSLGVDASARRTQLATIASQIETIGKPEKIENLGAAIKAVLGTFSLDIKQDISDEATLANVGRTMSDRCSLSVDEGGGRRVIEEIAEIKPNIVCFATPYWSRSGILDFHTSYVLRKSPCAVVRLNLQ